MAKNTHAQEVSTGTAESFTAHEMSDPEPHLALLRNRPTLRDEPVSAVDAAPPVPPEVAPETLEEIEEFQAELDELEPEEFDDDLEGDEPEEIAAPEPTKAQPAKQAPRKAAPAKKTATRRKTTDDYDFE